VDRVTTGGFTCACCGEFHDGFPAVTAPAPAPWDPAMAGRPGWLLTSDECVIAGTDFFVRAVLRVPIVDAAQYFEWGVWVSQSEANFRRALKPWNQLRPTRMAPTFGWLSTDLPAYEESTFLLKAGLYQQGRGLRPLAELEPTDHRLAVEQREGITSARVHELIAPYLTD
jgi:hypothetical protein